MHIVPILQSHYWLPINYQAQGTTTYKGLHRLISVELPHYTPPRQSLPLYSAMLCATLQMTKSTGAHTYTFSIMASTLWN